MLSSQLAARFLPSNDKSDKADSEGALIPSASASADIEKPIVPDDPNATFRLFVGRKPPHPDQVQPDLINDRQENISLKSNDDGYSDCQIDSSLERPDQSSQKVELALRDGTGEVPKQHSGILVDLPFRKLMLKQSASRV